MTWRSRNRRARRLPLLKALVSPDSFASVLLLLLVTYTLEVTVSRPWGSSIGLLVQVATVALVLRVANARRSRAMVAAVTFVVAVIAALANVLGSHSDGLDALVFGTASLLYLIAPLSVLQCARPQRRCRSRDLVRRRRRVPADRVLLRVRLPNDRRAAIRTVLRQRGGGGTIPQDMFFSFTTLTTTGYGNLVPAGESGTDDGRAWRCWWVGCSW